MSDPALHGDTPPYRPDFLPRRVILFSGHMVDAPGRKHARFPPERVSAAGSRIEAALAEIGAGRGDLALTQGAAGGDLLFAEACVGRGVSVRLLLPLPEDDFVARSILPSHDGKAWYRRYRQLEPLLAGPPLAAPDVLGPLTAGDDAFERGNRWLLASALACGADKLRFICLWDGGGGDGPGGTRHMIEAVEARGGEVLRIDTRTL
ncbi:MAG: hypothetical protein ABI641_03070 [Caldimonas sp.]